MDPFASHVIRSLLVLLCPDLAKDSPVRSKKSAAWKAKQGSMKSVFEKGKGKESATQLQAPSEFRQMTGKILEVLRTDLDENEVRAMAASKVASPGLKVCTSS
jgi:nucleolar protein 9